MGDSSLEIAKNERLKTNKSLIEPLYHQTQPNQEIRLGNVVVEFTIDGKKYVQDACATISFLPDDLLSFTVYPEDDPFFGLRLFSQEDKWDGKLKLVGSETTIDVFCRRTGKDKDGRHVAVFEPRRSDVNVSKPASDISTAFFHLFNFPDFFGPDDYLIIWGEPPFQGGKSCGRVILSADGWLVTIAEFRESGDLVKALEEQGGHVITHMGKIERFDGSAFSTEQLSEVLETLHFFLSFACGRWAGVALPVGFNAEGKRVFEQWGLRITADGASSRSTSWFDVHHGELLSQVFPGFVALRKNPIWREALGGALYWYLGANDRRTGIGVDTGLILAQTALELIAWTYCVHGRKMVTKDAFGRKGLSTANKLRLLASSMSVPLDIPNELPALRSQPGRNFNDGMEAITCIRNSLIHPEIQQQYSHGSYIDAWKLSLWYLDLVLLKLCGHNGQYGNRLTARWVGCVESVPWSSTP